MQGADRRRARAEGQSSCQRRRLAGAGRDGDVEAAANVERIGKGTAGVEGQCRAAGRKSHRAGAERGRVAGHDGPAIDRRSARIGVGPVEHQCAEIRLHQIGGSGQYRTDGRRHGSARRGAVTDTDDALCRRQCDRIALHLIAVHRELHPGDADVAGAVVDRHHTRRSLEDGKAGSRTERRIQRAVLVGPVVVGRIPDTVAAIDDAIVMISDITAIPEIESLAAGIDEVDLVRNGGLHRKIGSRAAARNGSDGHAVVGEGPAIIHQAIDAGAEATEVGHVERPAEREIARHIEQRCRAGRAQ